ncbi:putative lipoprotein with Yx(FWY)xxD motif [Catenulispora sp. EB89]|uniref:hypothetical protein n=1 Tax=Catenulispora sp. EB89 TaxID=3156257 RepID=UPI003518BBD8
MRFRSGLTVRALTDSGLGPIPTGQNGRKLCAFLNDNNGSSSCAKWPLYYYVRDTAAGDVDGQCVDGVWFAVGADGKLIKPAG